MTIAGIPALAASIGDEERRGAPGAPATPPAGGGDPDEPTFDGSDPNFVASYSGTTAPTLPLTGDGHGTRFTYTPGTWEMSTASLSTATGINFGSNTANKREPTHQDQAKMTFTRTGATEVWRAGRIDGSDRYEMNQDDTAYDGSQDGVGSGYANKPAMLNALILTGVKLKHGSFDPAVFPPGTTAIPSGDGPHLHSMAQQAKSYWVDSTLEGAGGTLRGDGEIELSKAFLGTVANTSEGGFGFKTGVMPYWPTFRKPIKNNESAHTGYIGRPRGVAGIPNAQLPQWQGDVLPFPQGLRMFTFKCGFFKPAGQPEWEFVAAFPMCWNGTDLWLNGGTHMAFLNSNGQPPSTHPFVLPMVHWFATISDSAALTLTQMENLQSAQATNANPAAIIDGQRRDYWNYNNVYVATHMELLISMDPVQSEAVAWMINNYAGLGRVGQRGDVSV